MQIPKKAKLIICYLDRRSRANDMTKRVELKRFTSSRNASRLGRYMSLRQLAPSPEKVILALRSQPSPPCYPTPSPTPLYWFKCICRASGGIKIAPYLICFLKREATSTGYFVHIQGVLKNCVFFHSSSPPSL